MIKKNYPHIFHLILVFCFFSCASIPKESVTISEQIGKDLIVLKESHENLLNLYYSDLKSEINKFVDEVYAPFIISFVLKDELRTYTEGGEESIYFSLFQAAENSDENSTSKALTDMSDFVMAAREQIENKRKELLSPILLEEDSITNEINNSYNNTLYANSVLTAHLRSLQKLKDTQNEALNLIGLEGIDSEISSKLSGVSNQISELITQARDIDTKGDDAYDKINEITTKIKETISKD